MLFILILICIYLVFYGSQKLLTLEAQDEIDFPTHFASKTIESIDYSKNARYLNKANNVIFEEITRYDTESVMMRTDINVCMMIQHTELDKQFEKLDN